MFSRRQQLGAHDDEPGRIARAREAAEALFAVKPSAPAQAVAASPAPAAEPPRKPRVLSVVPPTSMRTAPDPVPSGRKARTTLRISRTTRRVPRAQHARIRAWVEYGMTVAEVAEVCGSPVAEIERILRRG